MAALLKTSVAFIRVMRPVNLALTAFLFWAIMRAFYSMHSLHSDSVINSYNFSYLLLFVLFSLAGGYVINDYFDQRADRINKPSRVRNWQLIGRQYMLWYYAGFIILSFLSAMTFVALTGQFLLLPIFIAANLALFLYARNFKKQALTGNVLVAFLCSMLPFIFILMDFPYLRSLSIYTHSAADIILAYTFFAFILSLIREIVKDLQDKRGDAEIGAQTLAATLPVPRLKFILLILASSYFLALCLALITIADRYPIKFLVPVLLLIPTSGIFLYHIFNIQRKDAAAKASLFIKLTIGIGFGFFIIL